MKNLILFLVFLCFNIVVAQDMSQQYREKIYVSTDKTSYGAGETIWLKAFLLDAVTHTSDTKSNFVYVELVNKNDSIVSRVKLRRDSVGFSGHLPLDVKTPSGDYELRAYTRWQLNFPPDFIFRKTLHIGNVNNKKSDEKAKEKTTDFDCQFFPESGNLLVDEIQTVAFKAISTDGLSLEISGKLFDNNNLEILDFETSHDGMGKFSFQTQSGKSYYALVTAENAAEKRIDLPVLQQSGISLRVFSNRKEEVVYQVFNKTNIVSDSLFLLAQQRGAFLFAVPLDNLSGKFSESALPEGIITFTVASAAGEAFCERLYFSRNFQIPDCKMTTNKNFYSKRDSVSLIFNILSTENTAFEGDFSLSVTDSRLVQTDSATGDIRTCLLLTSDLKGHIENPQSYFRDNSFITRENTDILMLTQGWRKYHTFPNKIENYIEQGQFLTGKVLNFFQKPAKDINVTAIIVKNDTTRYGAEDLTSANFAVAQTDSLGQFLVQGIEFDNESHIAVRANSRSKIVDVELLLDNEIFPEIANQLTAETEKIDNSYIQTTREKLLQEGMASIDLDEVIIKGKKPDYQSISIYSSMADSRIDNTFMDKWQGMDIRSILLNFGGVMPYGQSVSIRGQGEPLFLVDGLEKTWEEVTHFTTFDIKEIALIKNAGVSFFGTRGANGVVAITLKNIGAITKPQKPSMKIVQPLGYQQKAEFYVPKYAVDSIHSNKQPDLRSTIYWNGSLQTDKNGNFTVHFYTADKPNNYRLTLEGISKTGEICKYEGELRIKN